MNHGQAEVIVRRLMENESLNKIEAEELLSYINNCEELEDEHNRLLETLGSVKTTITQHLRDEQYAYTCIRDALKELP